MLFLAIPLALPASPLDAGTVRKRLEEAVGRFPWGAADGYRLTGQFTLKVTGEDIPYQATYHRAPQEWVADFRQANETRKVRYGSFPEAWASSPEVTVDVPPRQIPFCAQYDFPLLHSELLRILSEEKRGPGFRLESDGREVVVRGRLWNGLQATFVFYATDYSLKKVSLLAQGEAQPAWLIPTLPSNRLVHIEALPAGKADRFEIWFSQVSDMGGFRCPRRTDYMAQGGAAASFVLETAEALKPGARLPERPPYQPWSKSISFHPGWGLHQPSLFVAPGDLPRFRARLATVSWLDWRRANLLAAAWGIAVPYLARYVPSVSSPLSLTLLLVLSMLGFLALLRRRYQAFGRKVPLGLVFIGGTAWILVLAAGIARIQMRDATTRSLITLHLAIRHAITGNPAFAAAAGDLLETLPAAGPPASDLDRADSCRAYAAAYDLASNTLDRPRQAYIERVLFEYAAPLYGALQGWRCSSAAGSRFAAGVGLVGLAIGFETYVGAASSALEDLLRNQLSGGLHREGPGPGAVTMSAAADFLHALNRSGVADYYRNEAFQEYVRTALLITSPAGTLPLFEGTGPDHTSHHVAFLLKAADHVPDKAAGRCVAACEAYWRSGRYNTRGFSKVLARLLQPEKFFLANPWVMLEYEGARHATDMPAESAVFADGLGAVLRSGGDPESLYLALNARRAPLAQPARDVLAFEVYAYGSLLLHGPGLPSTNYRAFAQAGRTSSSNTITFNNEGQTGTGSIGVAAALLNKPVFDYVRALADRAYDQGQFQRDVVLVRPDKDHPPCLLLIDEVRTIDPRTTVQWRLHGRGELKIGLDKLARWSCTAFEPPVLRPTRLSLTAYPVGEAGTIRQEEGTLYFENPSNNQESPTLVMEWQGSSRFCTVLAPRTASMPEIGLAPVPGMDCCRIGITDWISLGMPDTRVRAGPFRHVSEYVVVRERGNRFPAVLMIGGTEFGLGPHSISSSKPVFLSLDGLRGSLMNFRPDTDVELRSPDITTGVRFRLDGNEITATKDGRLFLRLNEAAEHTLALSSADR